MLMYGSHLLQVRFASRNRDCVEGVIRYRIPMVASSRNCDICRSRETASFPVGIIYLLFKGKPIPARLFAVLHKKTASFERKPNVKDSFPQFR